MSPFQLATKRTILTPVGSKDLTSLHQLWTKPEVRKYLWDNEVIPISQTEEIIGISQEQFQSERSGLWLMRKPMDQSLIGFCRLWYFFEEPQPQLLFGLDPDYFGQGYATEGATCIIDYAFTHLGFTYLIASCDALHAASVRVMERLKMSKEKELLVNGLPTIFYKLENSHS